MGCASSHHARKDCQVRHHDPSESIFDSWELHEKLGVGRFGQVRAAKQIRSDFWGAVKIVDTRHDSTSAPGESAKENPIRFKAAMVEARIWSMVGRHPHIVNLFEVFRAQQMYLMVMERCECQLLVRLMKMPSVTEGDLAYVFGQMIEGVAYVHSLNIAHRNIRPEKFIIGRGEHDIVKLCDFSMAAQLTEQGSLRGCFGDAPYVSPEMLVENGSHDEKTDSWSLGVTFYLMLYGSFPYMPVHKDSRSMKILIATGEPAPAYKSRLETTHAAKEFVSSFLTRDVLRRVPVEQARRAEFLGLSRYSEVDLLPVIQSAYSLSLDYRAKPDNTRQASLDRFVKERSAKNSQNSCDPMQSRQDDSPATPLLAERDLVAELKTDDDQSILSGSTQAGDEFCSGATSTNDKEGWSPTRSIHDISQSIDLGLDLDYGLEY